MQRYVRRDSHEGLMGIRTLFRFMPQFKCRGTGLCQVLGGVPCRADVCLSKKIPMRRHTMTSHTYFGVVRCRCVSVTKIPICRHTMTWHIYFCWYQYILIARYPFFTLYWEKYLLTSKKKKMSRSSAVDTRVVSRRYLAVIVQHGGHGSYWWALKILNFWSLGRCSKMIYSRSSSVF